LIEGSKVGTRLRSILNLTRLSLEISRREWLSCRMLQRSFCRGKIMEMEYQGGFNQKTLNTAGKKNSNYFDFKF